MYEKFHLPIAPVYGGFPVKFRTFLGDPILYDPNVNAAELAEKVSELKLLRCYEFYSTIDILEKHSCWRDNCASNTDFSYNMNNEIM